MNASIKNPRKVAPKKSKAKTETMTRAQMLKALEPKAREIVDRADTKTKAMLLDAFRFGRAGLFR